MSEVGEGGRVDVGVTLATLERETGSKQSTRTVPAWSAWSTAAKNSTRLTYRGEDGCGDVLFRTEIPAAQGLRSCPGVRWSSCRGTHPVPMLQFQWLSLHPKSVHSLIDLQFRQGRLDTARQRTAPLCSGFKVSLLAFSTLSFSTTQAPIRIQCIGPRSQEHRVLCETQSARGGLGRVRL